MGFRINYKCNTFVKSLCMRRKVVGIAMGGYSSEREISLSSGSTVIESLSPSKWNCFKIIVDQEKWLVVDLENNTYPLKLEDFSFKLVKTIVHFDVVFNAIHGTPGEDGKLAKLLSSLNIPQSSCDEKAASLTFDKRACLKEVRKWGVPVANSFTYDQGDSLEIDDIIKKVGLPCFVKPNRSGSSYGIVKVYEKEDLEAAIVSALKEDSELIIESALLGTEISVGAFANDHDIVVLPITEIISENDFFDFDAKYNGKSKEITPARLDGNIVKKVDALVRDLYQKLNLKGVCRSEFIIVAGVPHLLEINTVPGLTTASLIPQQLHEAGIGLSDFFESLLEGAMKKNQ